MPVSLPFRAKSGALPRSLRTFLPAAVGLALLATDPTSSLAADPGHGRRIFVEQGKASWYGPWHRGRRTATGERFDPAQMTAAHPTLPLGSRVKVTNVTNGRSVDVRINDRGPYRQGRVLDLSERAAERLAMSDRGVARVRIQAYADDQPTTRVAELIEQQQPDPAPSGRSASASAQAD